MKKINLKKSYEELDRQLKLCDERRHIATERKEIAHANQFENKLFFKMIFGLGFYDLSYWIIKSLALTSNWILPTIIVGGSVTAGILGQKLVSAVREIKPKLRAFTDAKTGKEKFEEETKYAIELEKVKNRKRALQKIKSSLEGLENLMNSLSNRCEIKYKSLPTLKESQKKSTTLQASIQNAFEKLDILSTKSILNKNFRCQRSRYKPSINIIIKTLLVSIVSSVLIGIPVCSFGGLGVLGLNITSTFFYTSALATYIYMVKRTFERTHVFNKFNRTLDKDSLPNYPKKNSNELDEIAKFIDELVEKISMDAIQLQEELRMQEAIKSSEAWPAAPSMELTLSLKTIGHEEKTSFEQGRQTLSVEEQGRAFTIQQQPKKQ